MGKTIYVLEDNDDIRAVIELLLTEEHYEVFLFSSAAAFKAQLNSGKPDAYILDVMLPDGNGMDICCHLKMNAATQKIPVMMMSANFNSNDLKSRCPAEDFINKPFDIFDFTKRVAALIH